jgi:hypothetical protein
MKLFNIIYLFFCFSFVFSKKKEKNVYIIVHGTFATNKFSTEINRNYIYNFFYNEFQNYSFDKLFDFIRYFFNAFGGVKSGIIKISNSKLKFDEEQLLILHYLKKTMKNGDFYAFNWCGHIFENCRDAASYELYKEIIKINYENNKSGYKTNFILIGHSHGGNVILGVSDYIKSIDKLNILYAVLFGTPIYKKTHERVIKKIENEYIYKNIINIYSENDIIQAIGSIICGNLFDHKKKLEIERDNLFNFKFYYKNNCMVFSPTHVKLITQPKILISKNNKIIPPSIFFLYVFFKFIKNCKRLKNKKLKRDFIAIYDCLIKNIFIFYENELDKNIYDEYIYFCDNLDFEVNKILFN